MAIVQRQILKQRNEAERVVQQRHWTETAPLALLFGRKDGRDRINSCILTHQVDLFDALCRVFQL